MEELDSSKRFYAWPKNARLDFMSVLMTVVLVITGHIGLGQLPLYFAGDSAGLNMTFVTYEGLMNVLGKNYLFTLVLVPFLFAFAFLYLSIRFIHKASFKDFFTSRLNIDWSRFGFAAFITFLVLALSFGIEWTFSDEISWNYQGGSFWMMLVIAIVLIPIQSTCEELLFRSYFFKAFSWLKYPLLTIVLCSLAFGLIHSANPEIAVLGRSILIFYIWSGLFMGLTTYLDGGIELSMGFHAVNNIFSAIMITNAWQAFQTDALFFDHSHPNIGWEVWITLFLWQPLIFLIFGWKYKWRYGKILEKIDVQKF